MKLTIDLTEQAKPKLTGARKDRIAGEIIAVVERGANTFGQIRTKLGKHYADRELRAGIRTAKHWRTRLKRSGSHARPTMIRKQVRLQQVGRRYSVIEI